MSRFERLQGYLKAERAMCKRMAHNASDRGDEDKLRFWQQRWDYSNTLVKVSEIIAEKDDE